MSTNIINLYKICKTDIQKLNTVLNTFQYGTVEHGKIVELHEKFHTLPLSSVLRYKCGCCWELSLLEATYFSLYIPKVKYKLWYCQNQRYETHAWLSYVDEKGNTVTFESAWHDYQGLHVFKTEKEMMETYYKKLAASWDYDPKPFFMATFALFTANRLTPWQFMNIALTNSTFKYGSFELYKKVKQELATSDQEF